MPYSHGILPHHNATPHTHPANTRHFHDELPRRGLNSTWNCGTQSHGGVRLPLAISRRRAIAPRNPTPQTMPHSPAPVPLANDVSVVASFLTIRGKEGGRTLATCLWPSATWGSRNLPYLAGSACSWWWPPPRTGRTSRACCWTTRLARIPSPAHGGKRPHAAAAAPKYAASQTMTHTHARVLGHAPQSSQPGCGFWRSLARGTALEEGAGWWGEWQERQDACSWTPPR